MEKGSRTRLVTAAILAVVFGSGVFLGFALDSSVPVRVGDAAAAEPQDTLAPGEPEERQPLYVQVNPSETQQLRIDSIIRVHRGRMREVRDEFKPRFDELEGSYDQRRRDILVDTRESIVAVLTAQQAQEYRRLTEEWDRRQAERRERNK